MATGHNGYDVAAAPAPGVGAGCRLEGVATAGARDTEHSPSSARWCVGEVSVRQLRDWPDPIYRSTLKGDAIRGYISIF